MKEDPGKPDLKRALLALSHDTLARVSADLGVEVSDRRSIRAHAEAIAGAPVPWVEVLVRLKRSELKALCSELGLDTSGKEKAPLILRLTSSTPRTSIRPDNFVSIPYDLAPHLRQQIQERYEELCATVDATHHEFVFSRIHRVMERLRQRDSEWLGSVAALAGALLDAYCDARTASAQSTRILAALYYLCSADDVIPDYQPGTGYADDAYVLNLCAREICLSRDVLTRLLEALERTG